MWNETKQQQLNDLQRREGNASVKSRDRAKFFVPDLA